MKINGEEGNAAKEAMESFSFLLDKKIRGNRRREKKHHTNDREKFKE